MSRSRACACACRWCASSTGCACWKCVRPGIGASGCASACATRAPARSSSPRARSRARSRRYIRYSVATWSLRDRPARSRPPRSGPARSSRPRSSAVCTSSSSGTGTNAPEATSASSRSSAASSPSSWSAVSRPAACRTRACARDPARSYDASTQSKCTDADRAASAADGPPANRPPQRLTGAAGEPGSSAVTVGSPPAEPRVAGGGQLARQAPQLDEALGERLVERVAGVVGREVEVVQALLAAPARHHGAAAVHGHPDVARHVALGLADERVQRLLQRREPEPVVDQFAPALLDTALEPAELALDGDGLELLMGCDQRDRTGSLVHLTALDADEPVLDHVEPSCSKVTTTSSACRGVAGFCVYD